METSPQDRKEQPRKQKHIPWWLHLLMAILCYCFFKYLLPEMAGDAQMRQKLGETGDLAAPITAIAFLFLAANALFHDVPADEESQNNGEEQKEEDEEHR